MKINKNNIREVVKGSNTVNMFYKCLRLGWQSGVSFSESRITSWDLDKKDMWIRPMPKAEELSLDVVTNENIDKANMVKLSDLSPEMRAARELDGQIFEVSGEKMVANFGLGSKKLQPKGYEKIHDMFKVWTFDSCDEDLEQDFFTAWVLETMPPGTIMSNLIALRASESFERFSILKQSDYSTGQYAMSTHVHE